MHGEDLLHGEDRESTLVHPFGGLVSDMNGEGRQMQSQKLFINENA